MTDQLSMGIQHIILTHLMQRYAKGLQLREQIQNIRFKFRLKSLYRSFMSGSQVYYHKELVLLLLDIDEMFHLNGEKGQVFHSILRMSHHLQYNFSSA